MNQQLPRAILLDEPAPPLAAQPDESGFGFQDLVSIIMSQRLFMLLVFGVILAAGFGFVAIQKPAYFAEAQVALGPGRGEDATKAGVQTNGVTDPTVIESETQILRSNDLMNRLIDQTTPEALAKMLHFRDAESFAKLDKDSPKRRDLIQHLQGAMKVSRQGVSNVISVGFSAPSPEASVTLANSLVDVYLASKIDERLRAGQDASTFLTQRVDQLAKETEEKERAVAQYRAAMKLLSANGGTLDEQQYFKLQGEVVAARADLAEKQARLSQVQDIASKGGNSDAVSQAVNSGTISQLRQKEADALAREASLRERYTESWPELQRTVQEREGIQRQIVEELGRIQKQTANDLDIARSRLKSLESGLAQLEGSLVEGNRSIVRLNELQRDADASAQVYKDFMLRAREIAAQESQKVVDARAVSQAIAPSAPSTTSPKLWIAFFAVGGIFLALVGALARSALSDRIVRIETVQRRLGVPALVSVPLIHKRQMRKLSPDERTPEDFLVNKPMTAFAESLRVLAANLLSEPDTTSALAVAVTSAVQAEGKTTLSLSLGRASAMSGLRVLIMDCDARRPSLSAAIGEKPAISLVDVIREKIDWRQAAVPDPLTSAVILPINSAGIEVQTMFRPEAVRKLLAELRPHFDLIVMDCPPVLAVAETRWVTSVADSTIIVTQWNQTRAAAVRTAIREVSRAKGRVAGVVVNRVDVAVSSKFSFSDSLAYGYAGKGYYTE